MDIAVQFLNKNSSSVIQNCSNIQDKAAPNVYSSLQGFIHETSAHDNTFFPETLEPGEEKSQKPEKEETSGGTTEEGSLSLGHQTREKYKCKNYTNI